MRFIPCQGNVFIGRTHGDGQGDVGAADACQTCNPLAPLLEGNGTRAPGISR